MVKFQVQIYCINQFILYYPPYYVRWSAKKLSGLAINAVWVAMQRLACSVAMSGPPPSPQPIISAAAAVKWPVN